jgi:molecular chaperone GrpE (heat shock protein)
MDAKLAEAIEKVLKVNLEYAHSRPLKNPHSPEQYEFIFEYALRNLECGAYQIAKAYEQQYKRPIRVNVSDTLGRYHLRREEYRREYIQEIGAQVSNFSCILTSGNSDKTSLAYRNLRQYLTDPGRSRSGSVVARILLKRLVYDLAGSSSFADQQVSKHLAEVLSLLLTRESKRLLRDIIDATARLYGAQNTSITERVSEMIQAVDDAATEEPAEKQDEPVSLEDENADLRAALFGLKQELTELSTRIKDMQENAKTDALAMFLIEMNSPINGHLLDNVVRSGRVINNLLMEGWQPEPPEVEGVVYSLKMLSDYFVQIGLSQIYEIGQTKEITLDDLTVISYSGSEFSRPQERKYVELRTPGWKYKDRIITKPQAVEVVHHVETIKE